MIAVTIPTTDVNSESAAVVRWYVDDHAEVAVGQPLVEIETSKAILDVESSAAGVLLRTCAAGDQVKLDQPLGYVFETRDALARYEQRRAQETPSGDEHAGRVTLPARRRAEELGVDIDEIARSTEGLVTAKLVEGF